MMLIRLLQHRIASVVQFRLMRTVLMLMIGLPSIAALGQDTASPDASAASALETLELHWWIVTDDDFQATQEELWCHNAFMRLAQSSESGRVRFHYLPSGAPGILNKLRKETGPRRAISFLTTETGIIRGLCIGIPKASHFATLVEDAQDLMLADSLGKQGGAQEEVDSVSASYQTLRERVQRRTIRHYRPLLDGLPLHPALEEKVNLSLPVLQQDLGERFHLMPPINDERLFSIQQHAESMKYWADLMLLCMVNQPVEAVWPRFTAMVWQAEPWRTEEPIDELLSWYDQSIQQGRLVIEVDYSRLWLDLKSSRQPDATNRTKEMLATALREKANRVEEVASEHHAFRKISLPDLAVLWKQRKLPPIDLLASYGTESIHWIMLDNAATKPQLFPAAGAERLYQLLERR